MKYTVTIFLDVSIAGDGGSIIPDPKELLGCSLTVESGGLDIRNGITCEYLTAINLHSMSSDGNPEGSMEFAGMLLDVQTDDAGIDTYYYREAEVLAVPETE